MQGWTMKRLSARLLAVTLCLLAFACLASSPLLTLQSALLSLDGARAHSATYFVHSPTCFAREKQTLSFTDLPFVQGEKVVYRVEDGADFAQSVLSILSASVLWQEEVEGAICYYAAAESLSRAVLVGGEKVNLHIVVKADEVVIGTPIIFGGY